MKVRVLPLGNRIQKVLREHGIQRVKDLSQLSSDDVLSMKGLSWYSLRQIEEALECLGLNLGMTFTTPTPAPAPAHILVCRALIRALQVSRSGIAFCRPTLVLKGRHYWFESSIYTDEIIRVSGLTPLDCAEQAMQIVIEELHRNKISGGERIRSRSEETEKRAVVPWPP